MNMSGRIRVRSDGKYRNLYNDLKNLVVGDFHELFFLCACLGFKKSTAKPLGRAKEDRFWSDTITPDEYACYYSMLIEADNMNYSGIQDDKVVLSKIEEYANAGMEILIEELLCNYLADGSEAEPRLDTSSLQELPKMFLHYVFERADIGNAR